MFKFNFGNKGALKDNVPYPSFEVEQVTHAFLIEEEGDNIILESGDNILIEESSP